MFGIESVAEAAASARAVLGGDRVVPCECTLADRNVCSMKTNGFGLLFKSSSWTV